MTLSIVIPSHSRVDLLRHCLASVQRYSPAGTQWIVVDDGSKDGIVSRTAAEFDGVEVIRLAKSKGCCAAANAGIAATTGEIVEMLNDDAEATAGWSEAAIERFRNPNVVAVAPLVLQSESKTHRVAGAGAQRSPGVGVRIDSAGDDYDPGGFAFKRGHGRPFDPNGAFAVPRRVGAVSAAAGFYRREALLTAGGFPEAFRAYFDDVDLSCRLARLGEIWYEPSSVVWHRVSASHGRQPSRRLLEQQSRNEELLYWRNATGSELWRTLPRHVAVLAGKSLRRIEEGRFVPWSFGRLRAWSDTLMKPRATPA